MLSLLLASLPLALAATQTVKVGDGGLVFDPDTITGAAGDTIQFTWSAADHSVSQSTFEQPCAYMNGGINSGVITSTSKMFSVTLNDTNPIWVYCAVQGHCQAGMAMVINPPASGDSLTSYKSAASNAGGGSPPSAVAGGVLADAGSSSSSPSSTASSASGSASATSTASSSGGGAYGGSSGSSAASKGMSVSAAGIVGVMAGIFAWFM